MKKTWLSIILPVYNEEVRIEKLGVIIKCCDRLQLELGDQIELVVVNDGSNDQTWEKINSYHRSNGWQTINYAKNMGKGYAIKRGMLKAKGEWRLFMDIDLSVPLSTIKQLTKKLRSSERAEIVIASRHLSNSKIIVSQDSLRRNLGKLFYRFTRWWLNLDVSDITCGFKCFSASAAKKIFAQTKIHRWSFDAEIFTIARKNHFNIAEIPVSWKNDERSKVRFPHDLIRSLSDLLLIKYWQLTRAYS